MGKFNENFFKAIRVNCPNARYKALWLSEQNLHEINYTKDIKENKIEIGNSFL